MRTQLDLTGDIRHALRMLVRTPAFSLVAVLTFAVGIGVNTAVFSVMNGVLLRPLPYPDADRITMVWVDNRPQKIREDIASYPMYRDWRDQNSSYAHLAGATPASFSLTGTGEPERLLGAQVTANFFDVMGLRPVIGRVFDASAEVEGKDAVAVLSYGLWQRRFGGAPDVLGKPITLNGRAHEIIGVMPAALAWPDNAELWKPLAPPQATREARGNYWLPVIGRLKPGVSVEQAQTEMAGISARLEAAYPVSQGFGANVVSFREQLVGHIERPLIVLAAAVGFVLLIGCANLANLMLGRTSARRKELAIRTALGAGRGRLIRQIVTEAFVLAILGGAIGVTLAYSSTAALVRLGGESIPRPESITLDLRVLGFAFILAAVSALLSGLVPALQASRAAVTEHLREGGRHESAVSSRRTRNALVTIEIALAFVLLTGAGLLVRTLWSMQQHDRGFSSARIATMTISAPAAAYRTGDDVRAFYARLLEKIRALPGVESVATTTGVVQPLVTSSTGFTIEGRPQPPPEQRVEYPVEFVSPGFFETLGIPIVRGRAFTERDRTGAPAAIVINETMARMAWPGEDPIGKRISPGDGNNSQDQWLTVVGVIRDIHRADAVTRAVRPEVYFSTLQQTPRTEMLLVKTSGDPAAIVPSVRRELQAINPQLPLYRVGTLADQFDVTLNQPRFQALLLAVFAGVALLLAAIGIYGVTSHAVSQRTQEVGIRMALGARAGDVLRLVIGQHLRPALIGIAIGLTAALVLSRYLRVLLYGVAPTDPLTFVSMAAALVAVAAVACWIPARRATRIDPLAALRAE